MPLCDCVHLLACVCVCVVKSVSGCVFVVPSLLHLMIMFRVFIYYGLARRMRNESRVSFTIGSFIKYVRIMRVSMDRNEKKSNVENHPFLAGLIFAIFWVGFVAGFVWA